MWNAVPVISVTVVLAMYGLATPEVRVPTNPAAAMERENEAQPASPALPEPVTVSNQIGYTLQKGTEGPNITTVEEGKGWAIQDGDTTIANDKVNRPGLETSLRIDKFAIGKDTAMVKVVLTPTKRSPEFVALLETTDGKSPPTLRDTKGTKYPAVGFVFRDSTMTKIRYTLGSPLKGLDEAPAVSRNRPDRELTLIFIVNDGVDLKELKIGKVLLEDWSGAPKHVDAKRR